MDGVNNNTLVLSKKYISIIEEEVLMKPQEKKGILVLICIVIIVLLVVFFVTRNKNEEPNNGGETSVGKETNSKVISQTEFTQTQEDGTTVNISSKLKEEREVDGFLITNISFSEKKGDSELVAYVTNNTGSDQKGFLVDIVLLNRDNSEIGRIPASIVETKAEETIQLRAKITENYVDAYDFKLEKK